MNLLYVCKPFKINFFHSVLRIVLELQLSKYPSFLQSLKLIYLHALKYSWPGLWVSVASNAAQQNVLKGWGTPWSSFLQFTTKNYIIPPPPDLYGRVISNKEAVRKFKGSLVQQRRACLLLSLW